MATKPPSDADISAVIAAIANASGNQVKAAKSLGIARSTLRSRLDYAERQRQPAKLDTPKKAPENLTEREQISAADTIRDLRAQIKAIHRTELTTETVRDHIFGLAQRVAEPPHWVIEPKERTGTTGVPCTIWSDWHWGEVVNPHQVKNINAYNLEVAHARLRRLVESTIDLCFNHMTKPRYPGIVINLGGDMISGEIHEELTETNELPSMPLILDLFDKLVWALSTMADKFGHVFVPGAVGNHGRTKKKSPMKDRVFSNFDWMLYQMLERHFKAAKDDRLVFLPPLGTDVEYAVYGHKYLLTHGDALGVSGGDGIIGALGPILRGTFKTGNAASKMGHPFDTILMGHWHRYIALRGLIVNGSLKGYDEFAMAMRFSPDEAEQALWFTHPKYGITCQWPIRLETPKHEAAAPWVSFPGAP